MSRFVLLVALLATALLQTSSFTTPCSLKPAFVRQEISSQALHAKKKKKKKKKSLTDPAAAPAASVTAVVEGVDEPSAVAITAEEAVSDDAGDGKKFLNDVVVNQQV